MAIGTVNHLGSLAKWLRDGGHVVFVEWLPLVEFVTSQRECPKGLVDSYASGRALTHRHRNLIMSGSEIADRVHTVNTRVIVFQFPLAADESELPTTEANCSICPSLFARRAGRKQMSGPNDQCPGKFRNWTDYVPI